MALDAADTTRQIVRSATGVFDPRVISDKDRQDLSHHVAHIAHMLSEQGPMSVTFVHNNTLLGLQSMHFEDAIKKSESFSGGRGYLDNAAYRDYHARGRITDGDIRDALSQRKDLDLDKEVAKTSAGKITAGEIYHLNMVHGFDGLSPDQLKDKLFGDDALSSLDAGISETARTALVAAAREDAAELGKINNLVEFAAWLGATLGLELAESGPDMALLEDEVEATLRDLFDIEATPSDLAAFINAHPEAWAARNLFHAVLDQLDLQAPTEGSDEAEMDRVNADAQTMAQLGGPLIPTEPKRRAAIKEVVTEEIDALDQIEARGPAEVERARVAWTILHGLGEDSIDRAGYAALTTLLTQRGAKTGAEAKLPDDLRRIDPRGQMTRYAEDMLTADLSALEAGENHADFLERITDAEITKHVNDYMIGVCSAFLDEGLASWHMPSRATGFFDSWRNLVRNDRSFDFDGVTDWRGAVGQLPLSATDAVISQLVELGIDQSAWSDYCGRALAHLRGWAGMIFWRQENGGYGRQQAQPIDLMQYLAVRLFYQNLLVTKAATSNWNLQPGMEALRAHFSSHLDEYFVRRELYAGHLSDALTQQAQALVQATGRRRDLSQRWQALADQVWAERHRGNETRAAADKGWRLYRLAQHLGVPAAEIRKMSKKNRDGLLTAMDEFAGKDHGPAWLLAFEKNYRDEICNALALNRGRGRWLSRKESRPKSQIVFCIDEREESIHRHYEELDPGHETLGAAGFFGVAMEYRGLDEHGHTPLCPAPVTPEHRILEIARSHEEGAPLDKHTRRAKWAEVFHDTYWEMKRNPISSYFLIDVSGFLMSIPLLGRMFFPLKYFGAMDQMGKAFVPDVETRLAVDRDENRAPDGIVNFGFTVTEQADRVMGLLQNIGLLDDFAPIVVICAHGSSSENNPYINAYDCGACGGKGGEPNSRAVAVMANNPKVREVLAERGIHIPEDTWFVGGFHNTATEIVTLTDEVDIPDALRPNYEAVKRDMAEAVRRAARERCRRFASAPKDSDLDTSLHHTMERASDFSQIRPELGHATNACAVVGRRALTQGVFFDRRSFVISYDPTTDPEGTVLERILLAVGPVGAGINLEYYFSTVDPGVYGSDSKVPHNVSGLIGVMEGAHSDLRTGLPRQMTEVHEPMRLHLIVDADPNIAGAIYGRQPGIQQLLDGEWVILIVHDPATGDLLRFVPGVGFEKWDDSDLQEIPEVAESYDWFKGKYQCFLPPARITEPTKPWLE
ncbi:putative transmembrane protein [Candidatus Rhodobacter oscarellae]|uniref:Probable inorganic carbon transporter subunit DabA n=1 Tax=Candidatus Rhodobacter oscarellae TaxID=1675527 RepID=A0A0J9EBB0_9RHOB|nr:DUF2309 domain-containing protein [Candidatus Rhodobacter lobularis]KMW59931.1 putative transmembrane protein [Candidatus Rhodobacter lobularis]